MGFTSCAPEGGGGGSGYDATARDLHSPARGPQTMRIDWPPCCVICRALPEEVEGLHGGKRGNQ